MPEIVDPRNQRQPSNLRGLEGTSPWSERGHGSPLSRRDCRPGSLLFPHHALLRDEFRKVQLDEPHLLDRQRLAFCECTNARCFSGVVVDASNVRCCDPERTSALMTRRHSSARAVADLRPPVRCDERVNLNPSAAILLKTCFQASKGGRASV